MKNHVNHLQGLSFPGAPQVLTNENAHLGPWRIHDDWMIWGTRGTPILGNPKLAYSRHEDTREIGLQLDTVANESSFAKSDRLFVSLGATTRPYSPSCCWESSEPHQVDPKVRSVPVTSAVPVARSNTLSSGRSCKQSCRLRKARSW